MISKIFSGRFILTIACAFVFTWCALNKLLEAATISAIITMVFQAYFNRNDRNGGEQK